MDNLLVWTETPHYRPPASVLTHEDLSGPMIINALIQTAARARDSIDEEARRKTIAFIRGKWNPDGGVCGRSKESDLYYTAFAAMAMRALKGPIPKLRLWFYLRSFGDGSSLDISHLFCLIRLHSIYPMTRRTRDRLIATLHNMDADTATDMFLKIAMAGYLQDNDRPDVHLTVRSSDRTSDLAAAAVINNAADPEAEALLMGRYCESGGFFPTEAKHAPTMEATAKALYALKVMQADRAPVRAACLNFIESLHRGDGGYAGSTSELASDVESTFFALFSIGSLMGD